MSDTRLARAALSRLVEPEDKEVAALVAAYGVVGAVERIQTGHGTLARFAARVRALDTDRDLRVAHRVGARLLVPGDDEWPVRLDELALPPWCLWVRGPADLAEVTARSVAVVGSRTSTLYGEQVASTLGADLAARGWTVVSGAALGIDASAHRGALAADGHTVAVLAGGVERAYPAANSALIARVAETCAVVSEVAPGSAPMRSRFLHRNRLIAAMTRGTVVVEADLRSGSRNTVNHAVGLGRHVGAVPGPVTSMVSAGCHQEVRDGRAVIVTSAAEVIDLVGDLGVDACEPATAPTTVIDALEPGDQHVLEALPWSGGADLDGIARATALPLLRVRAALSRLVEAGLVHDDGGSWRKRRQRVEKAARTPAPLVDEGPNGSVRQGNSSLDARLG